MSSKKKIIKNIKKNYSDPVERFKKLEESKIYHDLDILTSDTDVVPRNQKYCVISYVEPDEIIHELFYSYCFSFFSLCKYSCDSLPYPVISRIASYMLPFLFSL